MLFFPLCALRLCERTNLPLLFLGGSAAWRENHHLQSCRSCEFCPKKKKRSGQDELFVGLACNWVQTETGNCWNKAGLKALKRLDGCFDYFMFMCLQFVSGDFLTLARLGLEGVEPQSDFGGCS